MHAHDIEHLVELSAPAVHPDGAWTVVAASRPSIAANRAVGQLWRVSLDDGTRTRLTQGVADANPRLTPDGRRILFVRADADDRPQVWVMPADGGEPMQATALEGGVRDYRVSPDGRRLAVTTSESAPGRGRTVEGLRPDAQSPRRIRDLQAQRNGVGYRIDAHARIAVVDLIDADAEPDYERAPAPSDAGAESPPKPATRIPEARVVTSGDVDHVGATWSRDGTELLAIRVDHDRGVDLRNSIVAVPADGGDERTILGTDRDLSFEAIVVDAEGLWLGANEVGERGVDFVARHAIVLRFARGDLRAVTDDDTTEAVAMPGTMLDGAPLILAESRGRVGVVRVSDDGPTTLVGDAIEVRGVDVAGDRVVVTAATPTSFGEVAVVEDGALRILTDFGASLVDAGVVLSSEHDVEVGDGARVHGWVWVPEGEGPHPVLLNIHGGPFAAYGVGVFDEAQVAVDAGYAVVQCNPRGSAGYGREHGLAIKQAMGTVDASDVLAFLDAAIAAHPSLDPARLGIMGGSYGGYLTAWTIAHDHRFAAAIVERGFLDPVSFVGTSDIGGFFGDEYVGVDPEQVAAQSPMAHVADVTTPTLVIHSERDLRCPLEQAQRYFAALHRQGTEAELLVFPGEDHELTRSGQPRHRVERFEAVLEWWARHLPIGTAADED